MMLFLYFAFWVTYQCISLLEEVSYVLCDSFINVLFAIPDLVQKPALQMAQEHANPDQWNAHAAAKTAAEGAIHTAHYEPANPQVMHQHNITEQLIQPTMQLIQPTMNPPTPQFMQQHNIMEQLIQPTMNPPTDDDMQQLISLIAQIQ